MVLVFVSFVILKCLISSSSFFFFLGGGGLGGGGGVGGEGVRIYLLR